MSLSRLHSTSVDHGQSSFLPVVLSLRGSLLTNAPSHVPASQGRQKTTGPPVARSRRARGKMAFQKLWRRPPRLRSAGFGVRCHHLVPALQHLCRLATGKPPTRLRPARAHIASSSPYPQVRHFAFNQQVRLVTCTQRATTSRGRHFCSWAGRHVEDDLVMATRSAILLAIVTGRRRRVVPYEDLHLWVQC